MTMFKRKVKDFHGCLGRIQSFTDNQAKVKDWDSDNMDRIVLQLQPNEGPYQGGKFDFEILLGEGYPKSAPEVNCLTKIYHPNIDFTCDNYNVCLNLFDEWSESNNLEDAIQGLLFLLHNPNLEDPLNPFFEQEMCPEDFMINVRQSLKGGIVGDDDEEYEINMTDGIVQEDVAKEIEAQVTFYLRKTQELVQKLENREESSDNKKLDAGSIGVQSEAFSTVDDACGLDDRSSDDDICDQQSDDAEGKHVSRDNLQTNNQPVMIMSRQPSKVEKSEGCIEDVDVPLMTMAEPVITPTSYHIAACSVDLTEYIPRVYLLTDADFYTQVILVCVELASSQKCCYV